MERYEMMRDCGRPWLGQIPRHWKILRMKNVFEVVSERNHPDAEVLSLYREYGVLPKSSRDDNYNVTSEDTASYKFVRVDDLVINKMKAWQGSLGISQYEGIVSPAYYVCRFINSSVSKRYYHYLLRSRTYAQEFERLSTGMRVGQWDLGIDDFLNVPALIPPLTEQEAIASYLDDRVSQIDSIITEALASIEEYKQWKSSAIFEATTKGISRDVEMRDSRVEWIGRIPKGWKIASLKHLCSMQAGKNLTAEQILENGKYPVYGGNGIRGYYYQFNNEGSYILVGRQGALCGNAHLVEGQFWATEHAVVTTNKPGVDLAYLYFMLIAMNLNQYASNAAAQPGLSVNVIQNIKTVFPPLSEQKNIAKHLSERCSQIDSLIEEKKALVYDLETYKRSLIYETVTGKRKVV